MAKYKLLTGKHSRPEGGNDGRDGKPKMAGTRVVYKKDDIIELTPEEVLGESLRGRVALASADEVRAAENLKKADATRASEAAKANAASDADAKAAAAKDAAEKAAEAAKTAATAAATAAAAKTAAEKKTQP